MAAATTSLTDPAGAPEGHQVNNYAVSRLYLGHSITDLGHDPYHLVPIGERLRLWPMVIAMQVASTYPGQCHPGHYGARPDQRPGNAGQGVLPDASLHSSLHQNALLFSLTICR
jgi:hypothetical protein